MRFTLTGLAFFIVVSALLSQNNSIGGRSAALSGASSTLTDVWSAHNNQAGLGFVRSAEAGAYYENRFLLKELSYSALAVALPLKKNGTFGLTYTNFGYSIFRQTKAGIGYGMKFGENFSAGLQLDYFYTLINDAAGIYGRKGIVTGELGFLAKLTRQVTFSGHIYNPVRARIADYNNEILPVIINSGLQYKVSDKVFLSGEAEKSSYSKVNIKGGVEYQASKEICLRAGGQSNPIQMAFGAGFNFKGLNLDLSSSWHSILGFSPQMGLSYRFGKEQKDSQEAN